MFCICHCLRSFCALFHGVAKLLEPSQIIGKVRKGNLKFRSLESNSSDPAAFHVVMLEAKDMFNAGPNFTFLAVVLFLFFGKRSITISFFMDTVSYVELF